MSWLGPATLDGLRCIAQDEADKMGSPPRDPVALARWNDAHWSAVTLLAALADLDAWRLLRAISQAPVQMSDDVVELLLAAAEQCDPPPRRRRRRHMSHQPPAP